METDLLNVPYIDESISLIDREVLQDNISASSDEVLDSRCSSPVVERIELKRLPNGFANGIAMHAPHSSNSDPSSVAIQQSSGITVGTKILFTGPVVIRQFHAEDDILKRNKTENVNSVRTNRYLISKRYCWKTIVSVMVVALIVTTTVILTLRGQPKDEAAIQSTTSTSTFSITSTTSSTTPDASTESEVILTKHEITVQKKVHHEMIMRSTWGALAPRVHTNLQFPIKRVIISHTVRPQCMNFDECVKEVRTMQLYEMAADHDPDADIAVNFLVGGDGSTVEGRGYRVGAHTRPYGANRNSICIAFMGNFNTVVPPAAQLEAAKRIIDEGIKQKKIHPDYKLYGHRQFYATDSPGHLLYAIIKSWPHWSEVIVEI